MPASIPRVQFSRMSLRSVSFCILLIFGVIPLSVFALWPHSRALELEVSEVNQRHLLIARNLGAALERYHQDLVSTFNYVADRLEKRADVGGISKMLEGLQIRHICIADINTGKVVAKAEAVSDGKLVQLSAPVLKLLRAQAKVGETKFSAVRKDANGKPIMLMYRRHGGNLLLSVIETDYFIELGKSVSFGVKGHAAILDHTGKVLAHPSPEWVRKSWDMSKIGSPTFQVGSLRSSLPAMR